LSLQASLGSPLHHPPNHAQVFVAVGSTSLHNASGEFTTYANLWRAPASNSRMLSCMHPFSLSKAQLSALMQMVHAVQVAQQPLLRRAGWQPGGCGVGAGHDVQHGAHGAACSGRAELHCQRQGSASLLCSLPAVAGCATCAQLLPACMHACAWLVDRCKLGEWCACWANPAVSSMRSYRRSGCWHSAGRWQTDWVPDATLLSLPAKQGTLDSRKGTACAWKMRS
jgi:hypothetical protein